MNHCKECGSHNVHISENGYDTVLVCRTCNSEEHRPNEKNSENN